MLFTMVVMFSSARSTAVTTTQQSRVSGNKKKKHHRKTFFVGLELCLYHMACHTMAFHTSIRPRFPRYHAECALLNRPTASKRVSSDCRKLKFCTQQSLQPTSTYWNPIIINNNNIFHNRRHLTSRRTHLQAGLPNINELNWQSFSNELEETLELPSISIPAKHIHWLLSNKESPIKSFLAHNMDIFEGIHPKIKVVRDVEKDNDEEELRKQILLSSEELIPNETFQQLVEKFDARTGGIVIIRIPHHQQPVTRILSKLLPEEAQPPPSSFEQVGHVVHINLKAPHVQYGKLIGSILLDRLQPTTKTVVNKLGEVGGPFRTYQMELLAGEDDYFVHVVEHGVSLYFDLQKVYWCTRLEGERSYMIEHEFQPKQIVADAFCGVGAQLIRAASKLGCRIVANDLNPDAVSYCKQSAIKNGIDMSPENFDVQCGDAREFIMNLGKIPNHLLLNFPLDSPSYLNALRWWPSGEVVDPPPRVHVYTFARGDDERTEVEVAIDMVADGLLPEGGYSIASKFRGDYLNELGCNVEAREIRDAAPGKLVICVSFSATRTLLRRMQGDYME